MSWPLTGKPLAEFNRMLSDWKQYTTFPFIGPDDIKRLYDVLVAAGVTGVTLTDIGVRPQYWLLQLALAIGNNSSGTGFSPIIIEGISEQQFWERTGLVADSLNAGQTWSGVTSFEWVPGGVCPTITIVSQTGLLSVNLPIVTSITQNLRVQLCPDVNSILAPFLTFVGSDLIIKNNPSLLSLTLPVFVDSPNIEIENCASLSSVSFPAFFPGNGGMYFLDGNAFDQTTVDTFLAQAVANPAFVSGTVDLSGGTNSAPSSVAPGSDYDILIGRGVIVTVNP